MMLAVDFTASNNTATQNLHHVSRENRELALIAATILESLKDAPGDSDVVSATDEALLAGLNDYQKVILSVGSLIEEYDADKRIPFLGFGAKVPTISRSRCLVCTYVAHAFTCRWLQLIVSNVSLWTATTWR
jgi:hypothetical protein